MSYTDAFSTTRRVGPETLVAVLAALGEPIAHPGDAADCLARRAARQPRPPPVMVAWDGRLAEVTLPGAWDTAVGRWIDSRSGARRATGGGPQLVLEDGSDATELLEVTPAGLLAARDRLPFGCHTFRLGETEVLVISAPSRVRPLEPRSWGVFAPTYGLWDERWLGIGDLTCLENLGRFAGSLGAAYVATLPLLADYCVADRSAGEVPAGPLSPYSPLSRMWWNEAYLDVARVPELRGTTFFIVSSRAEHQIGHPTGHVDIAAAGRRVQAILRLGLQELRAAEGTRPAGFEAFQRERPDVVRYAAFRAAAEVRGAHRDRWPARWRAGDIVPGNDVSKDAVDLHIYAQWVTDEQIASVASATASRGCRLMLDLPIGCRPDGYDTWAFPTSFAGGMASSGRQAAVRVGAPPDAFFGEGQDWGFCPLDPEGERRAGYPVVRGSLSHLLRHAGALRIDHVLGVQRLWWIPAGASPSEGAYVSYPSEELVALACVEAWRRDATVVGEDLGTVDPAVRRLLSEHGIAGMQVAVFDLESRPGLPIEAKQGSVAYVDTHDTATFAGWLDGADIDQRARLGMVSGDQADAARTSRRGRRDRLIDRLTSGGALDEGRAHDPAAAHTAVLEELGRSDAGTVIATVEDLWGERDPQNIPGTSVEHPNFCRPLAQSLGDIERDSAVLDTLRRLDRARRQTGARGRAAPRSGKVVS